MNEIIDTQAKAVGMGVVAKGSSFSLVPRNLTEAMELAKLISDSELAPKDYRGKPGNVLIAVQMGQEVGLSPMAAIQSIAVINSKPSLYGDVGKAILLSNGFVIEEDDTAIVKKNGIARCKITRSGHPPCERTFSVENAKVAGLWGKSGPWTTYPERQMAWRAFWFSARDIASDVLKGLQGAEEVIDYIDITPKAEQKKPADAKLELKPLTIADLDKYTKDKVDGEGVVLTFSPKSMIERGEETAQNFINFLSARFSLAADVTDAILLWEKKEGAQ